MSDQFQEYYRATSSRDDRFLMAEDRHRETVTVARFLTPDKQAQERVIHALRATAGIPTEALEAGVVEKMVEVLETINSRRELLYAYTVDADLADQTLALLRQIKGGEHG